MSLNRDIYDSYDAPLPRVGRPTEGPDPGNMEGIGAAFRTTRDEQTLVQGGRLGQAYRDLHRQLVRLGIPDDAMREDQATVDPTLVAGENPAVIAQWLGGAPAPTRGIDRDRLWSRVAAARAVNPDALPGLPSTREEFEQSVLGRNGQRQRDLDIAARAGLLPSLIGSIGGAMTDPINIMTMPIGGGSGTLLQVFGRNMLVNGAVELLQAPGWLAAKDALGEEADIGDAAMNVAIGAIGGGFLGVGGELLGRGATRLAGAIEGRIPLDRRVAAALADANIDNAAMLDVALARGALGQLDDATLTDLLRVGREGELMPDEAAAVRVIERQAEVDEVNPYVGAAGADAHADRLMDAIGRVLEDMPPVDYDAAARASLPEVRADLPDLPDAEPRAFRGAEAEGARDQFKARIARAESAGDDRARNRMGSSARGRYQFIEDTFTSYYSRVFGVTAREAQRAWDSDRSFDVGVQERLMDAYIEDSERVLRTLNLPSTAGNLYVLHFAGHQAGRRLLQAPPAARAADYFSADAVAKNGNILTGTVSEAIAELHRRVGGRAASVSAQGAVNTGDSAAAILRDEALQLQRQSAEMPGVGVMYFDRFDPDDIDVDAALMQFKDGGDAFGVTERLQGVTLWNPISAGRAVVWEALDGRRLIADGHQRLGLARRIKANDPAQSPMIDATVLREADGWDAESARTWAAIANISNVDTNFQARQIDAAKVFRGMPPEQAAGYMPPASKLVQMREITSLGDDAFGAVVNELVDPAHALIVARLVRDPSEQKALIDLLIRLQPRTLGEADGVIRQGIAAGFSRETQTDMFGTLDSSASLLIERARVLDRGLAEMRKLKSIFSTAARNADTLDAAGNRIDAQASAQEALDNAQAVDLVARLAWRAGPVKDAIDAAARELADGGRTGDVVKRFVAAVRSIDVDQLVRAGAEVDGPGVDAARGIDADGYGRAGDVAEADGPILPQHGYSDEPDLIDGAWPSRAEIESAGQRGFEMFDEPALKPFDEATGDGPNVQAESLDHDVRLIAAADEDMPTFLIDDGDGAAERSLPDLLDEFDRDAAAIEAAKKCL
jgi:hypothetical protein